MTVELTYQRHTGCLETIECWHFQICHYRIRANSLIRNEVLWIVPQRVGPFPGARPAVQTVCFLGGVWISGAVIERVLIADPQKATVSTAGRVLL